MPVSTARASSRILIVDDDDGVTHTFAQMLRLEGYQVCTAVSGERGLAEAARHRPDAIILDLRMPMVDGLHFLRQIRKADGHHALPVAVVTGDYFMEDAVASELRDLGAQLRYKPLWLEDLVDLARELLRTSH